MPEKTANEPQWNVSAAVPLFPLPNVVLFPRAVLPLHIFEERYKTMTADVLKGEKQIAMALLKPGGEKNYHGSAAIEPVVCVGTILAHERLDDGKYNFLLQGIARARVVREITQQPYRTAELAPLIELPCLEIDLFNQRRHLISIFSNDRFCNLPICQKFLEMLNSVVATTDIVDLIAFNLIDDVQMKQQLLGESDARKRADRVAAGLEKLQILPGMNENQRGVDSSLN